MGSGELDESAGELDEGARECMSLLSEMEMASSLVDEDGASCVQELAVPVQHRLLHGRQMFDGVPGHLAEIPCTQNTRACSSSFDRSIF